MKLCVRCTGTGTEIVGAPINFEVGAPGPGPGPRSFSWTDYWTGTDCLVKSSVSGPKLSVHRLTGPGPGLGPIKWKLAGPITGSELIPTWTDASIIFTFKAKFFALHIIH